MKKKVLIISNTNLFSVLCPKMISKDYEVEIFNLRYANESFDLNDHMVNQIREFLLDLDFADNSPDLRYNFSFNEMFLYRLNNYIKRFEPDLVIIELKNINDNELKLVDFIYKKYNIPIIAFNSDKEKSQNVMFNLAEVGIREILTKFNENNFTDSIERNIWFF